MISESTINKVRELAIGDVLEPYVRLSRKGSTLMGICPFHEERTGSFSVSPGKNLFHCFSCNRGGDAITFIMEKENLSFMEAIEFLARRHNIPIEYVEGQDKEQVAKIQHKETLLAILGHVQDFFVGSLLMPDSDESRLAREYAYGRWPEEFCSVAGIGYAPRDGGAFMEFCRTKGLDEDVLFELGLLRRGDDGRMYTMFRHRIMIPIRNRWGRIIAYTARYIGNNPKAPKYINSPNSAIYAKGECLFGIDRASRERSAEYFIIVEGAPDVLRMQSIGYDNTVAALGTAWTDSQLERLKKYITSLCFIPDSDVSEGKPFGPGFEAVMANGMAAVRKGFHVTVRELPFAEIPDGENGWNVKPGKNDADSFIHSREDYTSLKERLFIVWLAQKSFLVADSLMEERKCVSEIADLMRYVKDQLVFNQCIDELAKIYGKAKLWRDAVTQARGEARKGRTNLRQWTRDSVKRNCFASMGCSSGRTVITPPGMTMRSRQGFPTSSWNRCFTSRTRTTAHASSVCATPIIYAVSLS